MIEEFFKFLGQILKLTSEKRYDEALAAIDQAAHQFLKIDIDKIADSEDLQDDIFNKNLLSTDQLTILAELLKVKADIYKETNFAFSANSHYIMALAVYEKVQQESPNYSLDIANKIDDLKLRLFRT